MGVVAGGIKQQAETATHAATAAGQEERAADARQRQLQLRTVLDTLPPLTFSRLPVAEGSDIFYGSVSPAEVIARLAEAHGVSVPAG
jgi:ribosomal protein L9